MNRKKFFQTTGLLVAGGIVSNVAAKERNIPGIAFDGINSTKTPDFPMTDLHLKFTFGSDTRDQKTGRLDYCKYIAAKCGLTMNDFYLPTRKIG